MNAQFFQHLLVKTSSGFDKSLTSFILIHNRYWLQGEFRFDGGNCNFVLTKVVCMIDVFISSKREES